MNELNFRVANFMKMVSMFMVLGALLYFYAYVGDRLDFVPSSDEGSIDHVSKSVVFYSGLGIFAVFNLVINAVLSVYKSAEKYHESSVLLKSEIHKERVMLWIVYLIVGVNTSIASAITYLALLRINNVSGDSAYVYVLIFGLVIVAATFIGLLAAVFKRA